MNILCWNARGLGGPEAFLRLRKLVRSYSPALVFLMETRLCGTKARNLHTKLGFDSGFHVDSVGKNGGLMLLWNSNWDVALKSFSKWHIDVFVSDNQGRQWRFSGIYGHPTREQRHNTWCLLRRLSALFTLPWCCAGDFNEILSYEEKIGGSDRTRASMDDFRDCLDACELRELETYGEQMTWDNRRAGCANVQERLDRVVVNLPWADLFQTARVSSLDFWGSDHRVIQISLEAPEPCGRRGIPRFRYEPWWMKDNDCESVIRQAWASNSFNSSPSSLMSGLSACASSLREWSAEKFGSLSRKIKMAITEIEWWRKRTRSKANIEHTRAAERQLDHLLSLEEYYWHQRARADWLCAGDRNTKYFHARANSRRSKNRICGLEKENGTWVESEFEIRGEIERYFSELFRTSRPSMEDIVSVTNCVSSALTLDQQRSLDRPFSLTDVREAVFDMGPCKVPGPDGFHASFFQRLWHVVGNQVQACLGVLNGNNSVQSLNSTHIILIPKKKHPVKVSDFRPISLCNVIYKVISKVLANRLKPVLGSLVSESQSAFVPGRLISDNVAVAFELVHSLKKRNNGTKGWMGVKLDMSKAYDRVEWPLLRL